MQSLFFLLLSVFSSFSPVKLELKYFIEQDKTITVDKLDESKFVRTDYLNANSRNGILWVETEIPEEISDDKLQFVHLGNEALHYAELYIKDKDQNWISIGKTGDSLKLKDKSIQGYYHIINLNGSKFRNDSSKRLKIRLKIDSSVSSLLSMYLMNISEIHKVTSISNTIFVFILGIFYITLIFFIYAKKTYDIPKTNSILFSSALVILLVLQNERIIENYFTPAIFKGIHCYRLTLILICGLGASINRDLYNIYRSHLTKTQQWYKKFSHLSVYYYISALTLGIVQYALPVPYMVVAVINNTIIVLTFSLIIANTFLIIRFVNKPDILSLFIYNSIFFLIITQILFNQIRFISPEKRIFKLFDNSPCCTSIISAFILYYSSFNKFNKQLKTSLNSLIEKKHTSDIYLLNKQKKNYVLNNLLNNLANPLQYLFSINKDIRELIPASTSAEISKTISYTADFIKVITLLSEPTNNSETTELSQEPVDLGYITSESIAENVSILRQNGCYVNVTENYRDGNYVYTNKSILAITIRLILETVVRKAFFKSNVQITSEYENFTYIFTVEFEGEKLPADFSKIYFSQETNQSDSTYEMNNSWGTQLYVAKNIIEQLNGNLLVYATSSGIAIQLRIALKFYQPSEDVMIPNNIDELENHESNDIFFSQNNNSEKQSIFILEEDEILRNGCKKLLQNDYNINFFTHTDELFKAIDKVYPDLIFYSFSAPGTPLIQLLSDNIKLLSIPSIVTAKKISRKNTVQLLSMGISEIMLKPFPIDFLYYKANAIMKNRLMHREMIIKSITDSFRENFMNGSRITGSDKILERNFMEETKKTFNKVSDDFDFIAILNSANLTSKEKEIARLIADGKTDKEIAAELNISTGTVAVHNKNLYKKLKIHSRAELIKKSGR